MALKLLDTASGLVADRTAGINSSGAHSRATFYVEVSAITRTTGTLTVTLSWVTGAQTVTVATDTGITAAGLTEVVVQAPFTGANHAIPEPNQVLWDLIGDTTAVSGRVYAMYGDD